MGKTRSLTKLAVYIGITLYLLQAAAGIAIGGYVAYKVTQEKENLSLQQALTKIEEALRR